MLLSLPVYGLALFFDMRIVFIASSIVYFLVSLIYPMSQYSGKIDESDNSRGKKRRKNVQEQQPPVTAYSPEEIVIPEMPTDAELIEPEPNGNLDISSFIDDLASEGEGGDYDGYVE